MATGCSTKEVEMILAHEFAHLRRHDYLVNLLQSVVETLFFYHPAVWWISRRIRREREHACDDAAVRATGDTAGYARALMQMAARASTPTPHLALAVRGKGELRTRIERLLQPMQSGTSSPLRPVWGMAMLVTVLLAVTAPDVVRPLQAEEVSPLGPRGSIRDRNGVLLAVSDRPDRQIVFNLEKVVAAWRAVPGREVPLITYARPKDSGGTEDIQEPDIVFIFTDLVHPVLESNGLAHPFNANAMRVNYRELKRERPFVYTNDLTEETAKSAVALKGKIPGMDTRIVFLRHYPFKSMASHLLGYVKQPSWSSYSIQPGETGVSGIEKSMESRLASPSGNAGTIEESSRGADVYLTLDIRHQYIVERALRDSQPAIGRGAVVLLEVSSGDVLAMASAPSYDPNDFFPAISREKFQGYVNNTTNPLLNRAVRGVVPGATFKVATSLAAICDGKEAFQAKCEGGITYNNRFMQCWIDLKGGQHGMLDLRGALKESCGPYFYQLGNAIDIDKFEATVALLGIGQDVGIGLPENHPGLFPTRAWWTEQRPKEKFSAAIVANQSIGQGALQVSPLQMASLMVPVANGGTVWRPRLVDRIALHGNASEQEKLPLKRAADLRDQGLTASGLEMLRAGLRDVVQDGPAKAADLPNLSIAGKTGTAQNWRHNAKGESLKDNHTMFVAYAPVENPKWAICVFIQGGKGGGVSAAPIAAQILSQVSAIEAGTQKVEPKPVEPIKGNFDPVDE
ncbi:MAG: penicillin-binding transpeptidase domain-containing protein, partial [Roseimicrobium sp.]